MGDVMKERLLQVENLKTYFSITQGQVRAVDGVSFTLDHGESIGLVGESGCGKTTTALSVIKLLPEEGKVVSGKIRFCGRDITDSDENAMLDIRWKEISMVFQGAMNALNPVKRISNQIAEAILIHEKVSKRESMARVKELFELVDLDLKLMDRYPHEFSGGMRQRAIIAMALACGPKLVIGDEPTTALDVMVQAQIIDLINGLRKKLGMSLIMITHDLSIITETCDRIAVMYAGKIVETGTTRQVVSRTLHPYTDRLIHAFPNIYGERRMVDSIPGNPPDLFHPPAGCRFAARCHKRIGDVCDRVEPPLIPLDDRGHAVACHLYEEGGIR